MSLIIDIIIIAIILLSTYLGYKKGLIGVAFKIISFIIALSITLILYKPVSNYIIQETTIDDTIRSTISEKIAGAETTQEGKIVENDQTPKVITQYINSVVEETVQNSKQAIAQVVSENLTVSMINIIVMIGLFIIIRIILIAVMAILKLIGKIPVIKQFNEIGGILYGIIRGLLIIYAVLAIISLALPMLDKMQPLNYINSTIITKFMYNNNIILKIFLK